MILLREEPLFVQDEYLRVDPSGDEPNEDDELGYDNDQLGENSEITPLGNDFDDEDRVDDMQQLRGPGDDEDDLFEDDEDLLMDDDDDFLDDDDDIVDFKAVIDEDDDLLDDDDDDDLFDDDDDDDVSPDVIPVIPDTEEDEDVWEDEDEDDDDLLSDDDDDFTGSTTAGMDPNFEHRHPERQTGRMIDHEPGVPGVDHDL